MPHSPRGGPRLALLLALLTSAPAATPPAPSARTFTLNHRYLEIPIKNGAPKRRVQILIDGRALTSSNIELAEGAPDWWAFLDAQAWRGHELTVAVESGPDATPALARIELADRIKEAGPPYGESLRPQFHFSPRRGWTNDPNGLVFYRGEYHLFFQHNPYGTGSDNKHWGHAVSTDLAHWREVTEAIMPDELGTIYSGSAVVDWQNTAGFGTPGNPAQVLFYTAAGTTFGQCLAFSRDGRTYAKYPGNPVVAQIGVANRDPKVLWYAPGREWIMTLYVGPRRATPDSRGRPAATDAYTFQFLSSTDLKHWTMLGLTPGFYECPNMFELALDGDSSRKKWILSDASSDYMIGRFDGTRFIPETPKLQGHSGQHIAMYAPQVFSDLPPGDRRCIQIGWLTAPSPGMPFNQCLTMPMELKLITTLAGPRLTWTPVRELEGLRAQSRRFGPVRLKPGSPNPLAGFAAELIELRAEFAPHPGDRVAFTVRGISIVYDGSRQEIIVDGHAIPAPLIHGRQTLAIYLDRTTLEVFASEGLAYIPVPLIPEAANLSLAVAVEGSPVDFTTLEAHCLSPLWEAAKPHEGGR